jgi:hypothetical protein
VRAIEKMKMVRNIPIITIPSIHHHAAILLRMG